MLRIALCCLFALSLSACTSGRGGGGGGGDDDDAAAMDAGVEIDAGSADVPTLSGVWWTGSGRLSEGFVLGSGANCDAVRGYAADLDAVSEDVFNDWQAYGLAEETARKARFDLPGWFGQIWLEEGLSEGGIEAQTELGRLAPRSEPSDDGSTLFYAELLQLDGWLTVESDAGPVTATLSGDAEYTVSNGGGPTTAQTVELDLVLDVPICSPVG